MFENEKFTEILAVLRRGGVILYPTDTVWAVGCDATNAEAVEKVFKIKNRNPKTGCVVLVDDFDMLHAHAKPVHPRIQTLLAYHERPLTIIYDKGKGLASNVLAKDGSIAIRLTRDPFCRNLVTLLGVPLVAATANIDNERIPLTYGEISSDILENVDMVVKFKQDDREPKEPSVIARMNDEEELDFMRE
jgi:L-threonylcarbamoyladenylate synthase